MHIIDDTDNIYPEGTTVRLKVDPSKTMLIAKYQQRVYFCVEAKTPLGKQMPYFERELLSPEI